MPRSLTRLSCRATRRAARLARFPARAPPLRSPCAPPLRARRLWTTRPDKADLISKSVKHVKVMPPPMYIFADVLAF